MVCSHPGKKDRQEMLERQIEPLESHLSGLGIDRYAVRLYLPGRCQAFALFDIGKTCAALFPRCSPSFQRGIIEALMCLLLS
jgi:hypothetical protein